MSISEHPKVLQYLDSITEYVKNKKAHEQIKLELLTHIEELIEEHVNDGVNFEQAVEKAIQQTGNSATIGKQFDETYKLKIDWQLFSLLFVLIGIGLAFMFMMDHHLSLNHDSLFRTKVIAAIIGCALLITVLLTDYRKFQPFSYFLFFGNLFVTFVVLQLGHTLRGVPMLSIGFSSVNYIALLSPILSIIALAGILPRLRLSRRKDQFMLLAFYVLPSLLFANAPSSFALLLYTVAFLVMVLKLPGTKTFILFSLCACVSGFILFTLFPSPYRWERLLAFFNQNADPNGNGYAYVTSRTALEHARWWGNWFKNTAYVEHVPEIHTNFMFTYLTYQMGWVAAGLFVLLCFYFVLRMIRLMDEVTDLYGSLLMAGIVSILSIQFLWSIGMTVGLLPIMDVGLPLVSHSGTQSVISMLCLGVILSVYRHKSMSLIKPRII